MKSICSVSAFRDARVNGLKTAMRDADYVHPYCPLYHPDDAQACGQDGEGSNDVAVGAGCDDERPPRMLIMSPTEQRACRGFRSSYCC